MQTKKNPGLGRLAEENAVQRHSKISNGRLSGLLCWPHGQDIENRSAQPDSKFSNGRLSGLLCWPHGQDIENRSAQRHSKICKSVLSLCLGASVVKCFSAQLDSKFSKFRKNSTLHFLHGLHGEEMYSAQRHSKNSKLVLTLSPRRPLRLDSLSAQQDSKMTKFKILLPCHSVCSVVKTGCSLLNHTLNSPSLRKAKLFISFMNFMVKKCIGVGWS